MMTPEFDLRPFDPCPPSLKGSLGDQRPSEGALVALDIVAKYLFLDQDGTPYHSYTLPSNADIHNVGGYVDKVIQYKDPALFDHFRTCGVQPAALKTPRFPLLATRSPGLDLQLFNLVRRLRAEGCGDRRISLFDLGCTVAEHWTFLDVLFQADSGERAAELLAYTGIDKSSLLLTVAQLLHRQVDPEYFQLMQTEGSQFDFPPQHFDLGLSVGVPNHVYNPRAALEKMLHAIRFAAVLALWTTSEAEGFWTTIHSGLAFYFFSRSDLKAIEQREGRGRFFVLDFIPEEKNSQERSYIGLGTETVASLGCYHLLYSCLEHPDLAPL